MELKPETVIIIDFKGRVEEYTIAQLMEAHPGVMVSDVGNMIDDIFDQIEDVESVEILGFHYLKN